MFSTFSECTCALALCACKCDYLHNYIHLTVKCVHFGMLLCSSLENNTDPSAIVSIQVNEVKGLSDTLTISPIHLQFEVV